jgi:CRISPR-associated endonuclease/helicase Cas3
MFAQTPTDFDNDIIGLKAIREFYRLLYGKIKIGNKHKYPLSDKSTTIYDLLGNNQFVVNAAKTRGIQPQYYLRQSFKEAAKNFKVIDSSTQGVLVPYGYGKTIIDKLSSISPHDYETRSSLLSEAQRYSVNVFYDQLDKLASKGIIEEICEDIRVYKVCDSCYDSEVGLVKD